MKFGGIQANAEVVDPLLQPFEFVLELGLSSWAVWLRFHAGDFTVPVLTGSKDERLATSAGQWQGKPCMRPDRDTTEYPWSRRLGAAILARHVGRCRTRVPI